jgi:hypothetical protein
MNFGSITDTKEVNNAMDGLHCPWCDAPVDLAPQSVDEQQCGECLTTWRYEDDAEFEFALAA